MRQPDGRPRGFGYVTLDSPAAADRCLAEPQIIDGRVVDMKRAVPEGSGVAGAGTPTAGVLGQATDLCMGIRTHSPLYAPWPDSPGSFFNAAHMGGAFADASPTGLADHLWPWNGAPLQKSSGEMLDCVELLSRRVGNVGLRGREAPPPLADLSTPASPVNAGLQRPGGGPAGTLSANAPEFVPAARVPQEPAVALKITSPISDQPRRTPLGELTNITNIINNNSKGSKDAIKPDLPRERPAPPVPLAVGRVNSAPTSGGAESGASPAGARKPMFLKEVRSMMEIREDTSEEGDDEQDAAPSESSTSDEGSDEENEGAEVTSPSDAGAADALSPCTPGAVESLGPLPSLGSAEHAQGTCKRCNFFPKGRCQNGANCTFCHFPHDKRKPSRQEKRDRRAARLLQREGVEGVFDDAGALRSLFAGDQENIGESVAIEDTTQRGLAYTMLPGMPPVGSVKLPAPLALPGNGGYSPAGFCLPPGLPPPLCSGLEMWQPDEEVSPLRFGMPSPTSLPSPVLATVPMGPTTPQSVVAMSPTAAKEVSDTPQPAALLAAVPTKEMCTIGTQTIEDLDFPCAKCSDAEPSSLDQNSGEGQATSKAKPAPLKICRGRIWLREEMLRVRGAMESTGALSAKGALRTASTGATTESS